MGLGRLNGCWTLSPGHSFSPLPSSCYCFDPKLLAVVWSPWWWKSSWNKKTHNASLPCSLSPSVFLSLSLSLSSISARCVSPASYLATIHLHHSCWGSHGDQRLAKWQPANVQAGGGGGWWCREECPHHPILPEDLCAGLRSHDRGLVSQTHRDRRTVGHTGWWVGTLSFSFGFN